MSTRLWFYDQILREVNYWIEIAQALKNLFSFCHYIIKRAAATVFFFFNHLWFSLSSFILQYLYSA